MFTRTKKFLAKCRKVAFDILFVDTNTRKTSNSKMWANVGCALLCYAFLQTYDKGADYWMVFGGLILGTHLGHRYMNSKTGIGIDNGEDPPK